MKYVCKLCKRDFTETHRVCSSDVEFVRAHTMAHLKDLVRDMHKVCKRVVDVGWVGKTHEDLAKDVMLRTEIIEGGLFDE